MGGIQHRGVSSRACHAGQQLQAQLLLLRLLLLAVKLPVDSFAGEAGETGAAWCGRVASSANLTGHGSSYGVLSLSLLPDKGVLVSGGVDDVAKLWLLGAGGNSAVGSASLSGHKSSVTSLAYVPDFGLLASGSGKAATSCLLLPGDHS